MASPWCLRQPLLRAFACRSSVRPRTSFSSGVSTSSSAPGSIALDALPPLARPRIRHRRAESVGRARLPAAARRDDPSLIRRLSRFADRRGWPSTSDHGGMQSRTPAASPPTATSGRCGMPVAASNSLTRSSVSAVGASRAPAAALGEHCSKKAPARDDHVVARPGRASLGQPRTTRRGAELTAYGDARSLPV